MANEPEAHNRKTANRQPPQAYHRDVGRSGRRFRGVDAVDDNVGVAGYGVYLEGYLVQNETESHPTMSGLACGRGYVVAVDAYDAARNRSHNLYRIDGGSNCGLT